MGKVVKGSSQSAERYALTVPDVHLPPPDPVRASGVPTDDYGFATFSPDDDTYGTASYAPAPPVVDVEAITRQAQAVIDEATGNAEALLNDAHERARVMISDAATRADSIAEDARAKAHDEGRVAGTQAADRDMSEMLASMRNLVDMARIERHKIIESAEPELVRLALGIAERVVHSQIALDRGVVVEMAKAAIERLVDRESITVRVNPADIERMREHREDMLAMGDVKNVRIIEDQRVDRGGVMVETDAGSVDAKISTQIAEARKVLHIEDDVILQPAQEDEGRTLSAVRAS
jgi:flagellar biosynthesis/type III secretory pathway protein FliH